MKICIVPINLASKHNKERICISLKVIPLTDNTNFKIEEKNLLGHKLSIQKDDVQSLRVTFTYMVI